MNGSFFLGADRDRRLRRRPATMNLAGHDVPGMRGLYAHVSPRMRDDLIAALQARWERSLRERASIDPRSPVLLLDNLLAPFRAGQKKTISQIPPRTATAPILSVG